MVADSPQQSSHSSTASHNQCNSRRSHGGWLWVAYLCFMLAVFWITTPFMFHWPLDEQLHLHFKGGLQQGLAQMAEGNMQRRAGMFVLAFFSIYILSKTKNRFQVNGLLGWTLIFYLGWILCSLTWSVDPSYTLRRLAVVFMMWSFAVVAAANMSLRELAVLAVFVTGATLAIGIGNEIYSNTMDVFNQTWRFSGVFHCGTMAWNCSVLALSTAFLLTTEKKKWCRLGLWGIFVTALVFLLLTRTRTAVGAVIIALSFYGIRTVPPRKIVFIVLGMVMALAASYVVIGDQLLSYGEEATTLGRGENATATVGDLTGRVPLWKYSLKRAADRPLLGYGFSSFINSKSLIEIYREVGWVPSSLHSGYLNEFMGTGFIGMAALFGVLILSLGRALRLSKQMPAYLYLSAVILWLMINLFLETALINGMTFMTFFSMTCIARLAFLPAEGGR